MMTLPGDYFPWELLGAGVVALVKPVDSKAARNMLPFGEWRTPN